MWNFVNELVVDYTLRTKTKNANLTRMKALCLYL